MSWNSAERCPLPTEVNLPGGISLAQASRDYHTWCKDPNPLVTLGNPKPGVLDGHFTTLEGQTGNYSRNNSGSRCDWSANRERISGGYFDVVRTDGTANARPVTKTVHYCLIDGKGFETMQTDDQTRLIRKIKQVTEPTTLANGTYKPAEYVAVPLTIDRPQDLKTYKPDTGGRFVKRTREMSQYTLGDVTYNVHSSFSRGNNVQGAGPERVVVEWTNFEQNGDPLTLFETSGAIQTAMEVPRDYDGEPQFAGGESTCKGFFLPDPDEAA